MADLDAPQRRLVGVVLAAGAGRRLEPLSTVRPKPLCPVGGVALLDLALARVAPVATEVAVNLHHGRGQIADHLATRPGDPATAVHLSVEEPAALGTAGALGLLRAWIGGRPVVVHNADVWCPVDLGPFVAGWDGRRVRVLVAGPAFGPSVGLIATLLPWPEIERLEAIESGLYETTLHPAWEEGRLDVVTHDGPFVDCGTPGDYLRANLACVARAGGSIVDPSAAVTGSATASVVGADAVVAGTIVDSVIWPGARVEVDETLEGIIRAPGLTVVARAGG
jgi:N-acetyl-alpha-D-muramate 1-phosphate uridylyltransferase